MATTIGKSRRLNTGRKQGLSSGRASKSAVTAEEARKRGLSSTKNTKTANKSNLVPLNKKEDKSKLVPLKKNTTDKSKLVPIKQRLVPLKKKNEY